MEILSGKSQRELLEFLPHIKSSIKEWQLIDVRLTEDSEKGIVIDKIVDLLQAMFHGKEGKIYLCNDHQALILVCCGVNTESATLAWQVETVLPAGCCEVRVHEPSENTISKLEVSVRIDKSSKLVSFSARRQARQENIIIVADDDIYMRMLVKKGLGSSYTVIESVDGADVLELYKANAPDMVFLDIHMPGKSGMENLHDIRMVDPESYIIMLSADSSRENVEGARNDGVKGFLTKPFTKEKLMEHVRKCPTISKVDP